MFDLDEKRIIEQIKKKKCKKVLLQLPDGLKPKAGDLAKKIEKETGALVLIWFGSNFGACDIPSGVDQVGVDFIVTFGHNAFVKEEGW